MAGRVQKYAAATVAACGLAGSACAQDSPGAALIPAQSLAAGELRWSGGDARERWSLVAGAQRLGWDAEPRDAPFVPLPFVAAADARRALAGERAAGRLAFEWQRDLFGRRLDASFLATRSALALSEDPSPARVASLDERLRERAQRRRLAMNLSLTEAAGAFGLPGQRSLAVRAADDRFDNRIVSADGWSGAESLLRRDGHAETRAAVELRQSLQAGPFRAGVEARMERFGGGTGSGTLLAPALSLAWAVLPSTELFTRASRGRDDFSRPLAAIDPWKGIATDTIDPESRREMLETGARWRRGALELHASAWRARAPSRLAFSEGGPIESLSVDERRGYGLGLRYQPVSWLDLHADALLAKAAGGVGAPATFGSAGATVRMSRDWDVRLAVNYLGPRDAADEGAALRSTTLANAQVAWWLGHTTRVSLDVFNVFNQRLLVVDSFAASRAGMLEGAGEKFLSSPAEPRGFLLKLRTRF